MPFLSRIFNIRETDEPRYPWRQRVPWNVRTLAGVPVTPDQVPTVAAAWACLRYISQGIAALPFQVKRKGKDGAETAESHPVHYLLWKRPNPEWSSFQFRETLTHWALRWGNGYAEIERDSLGRPLALWPIHPERVHPMRDLTAGHGGGKLYFRVHNGVGAPTDLALEDMFHIRGFGEGPIGVNVTHYAAESIGWAKAAQLFGASFFGSGMNMTGVIESARPMNDVGLKRLRAELARLYRGVRGERTAILDNGQTYKAIQIEPDKAQFIATNQHLIEEIARWFGVPLHKIAHLLRSTNNNIEQQAIEAVTDCLMPWARRFEDEADYKLFGQNRAGLFTRIDFTELLRGDHAARAVFYQTMRNTGVYSANDILRRENENTIGSAGDKRIVGLNMTTLERVGELPEPPPAVDPEADPGASPAKRSLPPPAEPDDDDEPPRRAPPPGSMLHLRLQHLARQPVTAHAP